MDPGFLPSPPAPQVWWAFSPSIIEVLRADPDTTYKKTKLILHFYALGQAR